jgi:hypothetical protein
MSTYVTLSEARAQVSVDAGLTMYDERIELLVGAAEDWAENYTQRSLAELMTLDSPADESQTPLPEPVDPIQNWPDCFPRPDYLSLQIVDWVPDNFRHYWAHVAPGPVELGTAKPLRRDVKAAILLKFETLFDRNVDNTELLEKAAMAMLDKYRIGLGV